MLVLSNNLVLLEEARVISINLQGELYRRDQVRQLIKAFNERIRDGAQILGASE